MTNTEKKPLAGTDCVTPVFRMSYPSLFEARASDPVKPNEKNFGVEMLFRVAETPESKKAGEEVVDLKDLKAAATFACTEAWGPDKAKWPAGWKHPFKDGNGDKWRDKAGYGPGVVFVRASRKEAFGRPVVVDQNVKDVMDKNAAYPGGYARAKVHAYAWEHRTGGHGVSFTLDMLQLVRDGEPLGNRMAPEDAFSAIPVPAGSAAATAEKTAADPRGAAGGQIVAPADAFGGLG